MLHLSGTDHYDGAMSSWWLSRSGAVWDATEWRGARFGAPSQVGEGPWTEGTPTGGASRITLPTWHHARGYSRMEVRDCVQPQKCGPRGSGLGVGAGEGPVLRSSPWRRTTALRRSCSFSLRA